MHRVGDDVGLRAVHVRVVAREHVDPVVVLLGPPRDGDAVGAGDVDDLGVQLDAGPDARRRRTMPLF